MTNRISKEPSQRQLKVGEEIRHILASVIQRGELVDEDLMDVLISVTEVSVSPDLKIATAYVMPLGGKNVEVIIKALARCKGFLRKKLADNLKLRYTPDLRFRPDDSFATAGYIEDLFRNPQVSRDTQKNNIEE